MLYGSLKSTTPVIQLRRVTSNCNDWRGWKKAYPAKPEAIAHASIVWLKDGTHANAGS